MAVEKGKIEFVNEPCTIKPRKFSAQNIVLRLRRRETIACQYPGTQVLISRQFYQNVFPNFTVVNVEKPPCFLRKFSPDGRYLVAFSADQTSIEVYKYEGASAAAKLLVDCKGEYIGHKNDDRSFHIRNNIFHQFFKVSKLVHFHIYSTYILPNYKFTRSINSTTASLTLSNNIDAKKKFLSITPVIVYSEVFPLLWKCRKIVELFDRVVILVDL